MQEATNAITNKLNFNAHCRNREQTNCYKPIVTFFTCLFIAFLFQLFHFDLIAND